MENREIAVTTIDPNGIAMGWLDLPWPGVRVRSSGGEPTSQWVADAGDGGGVLILRFDAPGTYRVTLERADPAEPRAFDGRIDGPVPAVHDASQGAFPQWNSLAMTWDDSIKERVPGAVEYPESMEAPEYGLAHDRNAAMQLLSDGAIASVVRTSAFYCDDGGAHTSDRACAVYDWYYFRHAPLVWVRCTASLSQDRWRAMRFGAPRVTGLTAWCAGSPREEGACTEEMVAVAYNEWAMLHDGGRALGVLCGSALVEYDVGRACGGLVADYCLSRLKDRTPARFGVEEASAFFWVGPYEPETVAALARPGALPLDAVFTRDESPVDLVVESATVSLGLAVRPDGVSLSRLTAGGISWLPEAPLPVFTVSYGADRGSITQLDADRGWGSVRVAQEGDTTTITLSQPPALPDASVDWVMVRRDEGLEMSLDIRGAAIRGAVFPRLTVGEPRGGGSGFVPLGQGTVEPDAFRRNTRYRNPYAGPFAAMSFMGVYANTGDQPGLYLGWHDPEATRRDLTLDGLAHRRSVVMEASIPAAGMSRTARWTTPVAAVRASRNGWWGLVEAYRGFAQAAPWWNWEKPEKTWMDDTDWWVINSVDRGPAEEAMDGFVASTLAAADKIGVPPAVHAYNWHENPFDNDYPHYIPARPGFDRAVAELAERGVHVTPYINGRLWDTRDRGVEDWQFTAVAKPAVTKDEDGHVVFEIYGSKEADGSFTQLGVMCPSTELWQEKIADLVRQLAFDIGVAGVYVDQIAAMAAVLCFDETHGHPLGGGGWWRRGYGRMLERTRELSDNLPLTTECNAEPYVGWLDAYLMWHCMFPGQVPAFSALYSSRVRMFGRASPGGLDNLRALTAQSWVFGEHIGWFGPSTACDSGEDFARFLTEAIGLRAAVRNVVHQGAMLAPPAIAGGEDGPYVWGWDARRVVLPPVLSSLWRREDETVLLLANHSEEPVDITWDLDTARYGYAGAVTARRIDPQGQEIAAQELPARGQVTWRVDPCSCSVWRLSGERR